ncbi:MAG: dTDP-glucose 4,6-dehydratase [Dehalococcoidia bacterium]
MSRWLITGGAGFIGSNFIRLLLSEREDVEVVNFDALTYAGNLDSLSDVAKDSRYAFVRGDIAETEGVEAHIAGIDVIVNFAAESHVDRSIISPAPFVRTNVVGTQVLLSLAQAAGVSRFVQVSTDEVYGSLPWAGPDDAERAFFSEETPLSPRSPYSASKAAADHLVQAFHHTYGLNTVIARGSNNYGPYQFPEKLIPLVITNALDDRRIPVYGDGLNVRDWIYVEDYCRGILRAVEDGASGGVYNLGGREERTNLEVVRGLLKKLGKNDTLMEFVPDRPGHDRRYAMDCSRAERELGWQPRVTFEEGVTLTVQWYLEHLSWWRRVRDGSYREYYKEMYSGQGMYASRPGSD